VTLQLKAPRVKLTPAVFFQRFYSWHFSCSVSGALHLVFTVALLNIEPLGSMNRCMISRYFSRRILTQVVQYLARPRYAIANLLLPTGKRGHRLLLYAVCEAASLFSCTHNCCAIVATSATLSVSSNA
jgi:hypothetical protein